MGACPEYGGAAPVFMPRRTRCEKGDNRNNWFLNEEHTPAENRCAAYNDSVEGSLPTGRKIWHCHIGSEWLARTLTVTMMVRSNMTL